MNHKLVQKPIVFNRLQNEVRLVLSEPSRNVYSDGHYEVLCMDENEDFFVETGMLNESEIDSINSEFDKIITKSSTRRR
ncbi:MAG: hypothetical protein LBG48_05835 [Rickettsiales bacterium]|jgi:hypothetical protein|nr:hypothetical protein [Rickettsiales bacterium]